jgi:hypothetical protein
VTEIFRTIMFGFLAFTLPLGAYIAALDLIDWRQGRGGKLALARGMTRVGWVLTLSAIMARWAWHMPPIENSGTAPVFFIGVVISCAGFLGVAGNYHTERKQR